MPRLRARSWRDRMLPFAAPALLVAVAVVQIGRAQTVDQSSWQGTGFGMFATFESATTRFPVATDGAGRSLLVTGGRSLRMAQVAPTEDNLRRLAEDVARDNGLASGEVVHLEMWAIDLRERDGVLEHSASPQWIIEVTAP